MRAAWLVALVAAAACADPAPPPGRGARPVTLAADAGICEECACKSVECGEDAGPPPCATCDPETDGDGGCASGCCGKLYDVNGAVLLESDGTPRFGCVEPACVADDECILGTLCSLGETCDQNRCLCPNGQPPWEEDHDHPCCEARNVHGVCCETGLIDEDGRCVCEDPFMLDDGGGCTCAPDMEPDPETDVCVCSAEGAEIEPETGACLCPAGTWPHYDEYVGTVWCDDDDDPPPQCGDENAVFNPLTGLCECKPGLVLRNVEGAVTPACAPPEDGGPPEDARDAGVDAPEVPPDAGDDLPPDAAVVDAPPAAADASAPVWDAGVPPPPDAGLVMRDARLRI